MKKTFIIEKITVAILGLLLCIILLEIGLRLRGFIILSLQEHRNKLSIQKKGSYRIMCLGESTTQNQYPPFLEEILNQRNIGIKFSVIDKGVGGISTLDIVAQLEDNLNLYKTNMVITMMGINDWGYCALYKDIAIPPTAFSLSSFRIYKLARLLWLSIVNKIKEPEEKEVTVLSNIRLKNFYIKQKNSAQSEKMYRTFLKCSPARVYVSSGWGYMQEGKYIQAEESFKKAIELDPASYAAYVELGVLYTKEGKYIQAEESFKKAIELDPASDVIYSSLAVLYKKMGQYESAEEYYKKASELRLEYYNPMTRHNYQKLEEILIRRGIRLVCVQYPMRSIEPLKRIFVGQEGIIFVDNEKIFKDALRKGSYEEYFIDIVGGDFGHCTEKGNKLLAENIANVILEEVFNIKQ